MNSRLTRTLNAQHAIIVLLGILVLIMLGGVLYFTRSVLLPFMVALFLAYLLDPIVRALRRIRIPLILAVFVALLLAFALLALLGTLFYTSVQAFVDEYPRYEPKLRALIAELTTSLARLFPDWQFDDLRKHLTMASVVSTALSSLGSFVAFLGHLLLSLLFMVFILVGQQRLPERIHRAFGPAQGERVIEVLRRIVIQVQIYLGVKALLGLVTGVMVNLSLTLLAIDFAELWAALALLLSFIPNAGAIIAAIPPILVAILKFDSLMPAVWVVISQTAIHIVLSFIEPRLMGQRLNLSPLLVVLSLVFWGWLWGMIGLVLAVPMMATIKIICENLPSLHVVSLLMSEE